MKFKYKIYTLGCKVNQYDSNYLRKILPQDFKITSEKADFVFLNTCAVTANAIKRARVLVSKCKKENPNAKIVIFGCWPKVYEKDVLEVAADMVWNRGNEDMAKIVNEVIEKFKIKNDNCIADTKKITSSDRSRYFIKIQDGCEQYCSYCIIPYTRGKLKSRTKKEIIEEIKSASESGYREIVLSGIHLGNYGKDLEVEKSFFDKNKGKMGLVPLVRDILEIKELGRIRLSSIEVTEVNDELIELIKKNRKICRHLHIPLQAGSDKILQSMNRPYNKKYFVNKITEIKRAVPEMAITTDIIVGFPGENENDFLETYTLSEDLEFSKIHVFPFSAHERTPAATLPDHIAETDIRKRAKKLRDLSGNLEEKFIDKFAGQELELVVIGCKQDKMIGKSEYFFDVTIDKSAYKGENLKTGSLLRTKFVL